MEGERRASNEALLLKLAETVARIDERGVNRDRESAHTRAEVEELRGEVRDLRGEVKELRAEAKALTTELRAMIAEINAAKAVGRAGTSVATWLLKALPWGAAGGAGWFAALWAKH
jgi:phage shock protein A